MAVGYDKIVTVILKLYAAQLFGLSMNVLGLHDWESRMNIKF